MNTLLLAFGHIHLYEIVDMKMLHVSYKFATVTQDFFKIKDIVKRVAAFGGKGPRVVFSYDIKKEDK